LSNTSPVRISTKAGRLVWVEVSLPKLLYGHNGRVLQNQAELDSALAKLCDHLGTICDVPEITTWQVWRVDIAWNFDMKAAPLICSHAALHLPGIHRGATLHSDQEGVSWRGVKSRFMVKLYDKCREMHIPGSVLRAEISLRGKELVPRLNAGAIQVYDAIYRVYRDIMVNVPPIQRPAEAANWMDALGQEPPEIRQRILARLAHKPKGTVRRYRRQIEAAAANLPETFSWANILPANNPPPAVNCEPRNGRRSRPCILKLTGVTLKNPQAQKAPPQHDLMPSGMGS
jgi:hypothetical protein